jgi:hypothetical protein
MRNPWLDIPLTDYEGHMALPQVDQSGMLADQLEILVRSYSPSSLAIVGCAGGNGFDRLAGTGIRRVVGLDINPEYIEIARRRYASCVIGLEVHVGDIQSSVLHFDPVELIYAGLLFEYVDLSKTLESLRRHCTPNGILAVLLQLPHEAISAVSPSPYTSLQRLGPTLHLLAPDELQTQASTVGFVLEESRTVASTAGKLFSSQVFRLAPGVVSQPDRP